MSLNDVPAGSNAPDEVNVVIEIPMNADPVKYEVDKDSGAVMVDRFMNVAMHYPCNYGYVPNTLCGDGDPVDVLVITPFPIVSGSIIKCRPVAVLKMSDEGGEDAKIVAVPTDKISNGLYADVKDKDDLSPHFINTLQHFFEHYKDLEKGKWVKVDGWEGAEAAKQEIVDSIERLKNS